MSIKLKGSTDGSVTFTAPADTSPTGTDVTLTLPTSAGSANQFLKNSGTAGSLEFGALGYTDVPTGSVIQVVRSTNETSDSTTSTTTYKKSNITATITPQKSNSHLLVIADISAQNSADGGIEAHIRYEDTTTDLYPAGSAKIFCYSTGNTVDMGCLQYLDTAGGWSGAVQYRVYYKVYNGGTTFVNWGGMTILEIAQ